MSINGIGHWNWNRDADNIPPANNYYIRNESELVSAITSATSASVPSVFIIAADFSISNTSQYLFPTFSTIYGNNHTITLTAMPNVDCTLGLQNESVVYDLIIDGDNVNVAGGCIWGIYAGHISLYNCKVFRVGTVAIKGLAAAADLTLQNCKIRNTSEAASECISTAFNNSKFFVSDCIFDSIPVGIVDSSSTTLNVWKIYDNLFISITSTVFSLGANAQSTVVNNTFNACSGSVAISFSSTNPRIVRGNQYIGNASTKISNQNCFLTITTSPASAQGAISAAYNPNNTAWTEMVWLAAGDLTFNLQGQTDWITVSHTTTVVSFTTLARSPAGTFIITMGGTNSAGLYPGFLFATATLAGTATTRQMASQRGTTNEGGSSCMIAHHEGGQLTYKLWGQETGSGSATFTMENFALVFIPN